MTSTPSLPHLRPRRRRRAGFTLVELLVVVMLITVLLSLLLSAVRVVESHIRKTTTRAELKSIEGAWKQYFSHYQAWPYWPTNSPPSGDRAYVIDAAVARSLQGDATDPLGINPEHIAFIEFARFNNSVDGTPANAWGETGRFSTNDCCYYVAFDYDGDSRIQAVPGVTATLLRGVAVWTYNPEDLTDSKPTLIGSWQP